MKKAMESLRTTEAVVAQNFETVLLLLLHTVRGVLEMKQAQALD
jgi:hypothetical protein